MVRAVAQNETTVTATINLCCFVFRFTWDGGDIVDLCLPTLDASTLMAMITFAVASQ